MGAIGAGGAAERGRGEDPGDGADELVQQHEILAVCDGV